MRHCVIAQYTRTHARTHAHAHTHTVAPVVLCNEQSPQDFGDCILRNVTQCICRPTNIFIRATISDYNVYSSVKTMFTEYVKQRAMTATRL